MEELAERIEVAERILACDGGDGALGHPRVYLNMGAADAIDCPYCGRHYALRAGAGEQSHR